jgi:predicted glycosyltransferase involved in capsule biosynthesis
LKKQEKELLEIHKKHDSKEISLDKLRRERNNLYAAMNSDKYKDFTTVEEIEYKF